MNNVLFFSRDYQATFFPLIRSIHFKSIHVTLTTREKQLVLDRGGEVVACLEEDYKVCAEADIEYPYLKFSLASDRFIKGHTYESRLKMLKKVSSFWRAILEKHQPIAVVNEPIAIEVSEILWIEAHRRNIRYLAISSFYQGDTFYFQPNPLLSTSFRSVISTLTPDNPYKNLAERYLKQIRTGIRPTYVLNVSSRRSLKKLLNIFKGIAFEAKKRVEVKDKSIRQLCYGDSLEYYFKLLDIFVKNLVSIKKPYQEFSSIVENDFVFFPLHYEPECVISYGSYFNSDQCAFTESILKCLREDQLLVVKEHPQQAGFLLQKKFKNLKRRWPNLVYIEAEIPSFDLLRECSAVITLGGTVGFEALALNKSVINFGNVYFDTFGGVLNFTSFPELFNFFRTKGSYPKKGDLLDFTAKIFSILYEGNPFPGKNLFDKRNVALVTNAIDTEIESLRS